MEPGLSRFEIDDSKGKLTGASRLQCAIMCGQRAVCEHDPRFIVEAGYRCKNIKYLDNFMILRMKLPCKYVSCREVVPPAMLSILYGFYFSSIHE